MRLVGLMVVGVVQGAEDGYDMGVCRVCGTDLGCGEQYWRTVSQLDSSSLGQCLGERGEQS